VWVAERYGYRITVFNANGTVKATYGGALRGSNYFIGNVYQSTSVVIDPSGHKVYVGDIFNRRVQVYDYNTDEWDRFDNGQVMGYAWNLWADQFGRVFTTEYDDGRLQMLNQCGETLASTNVIADKFVGVGNDIYAVDYRNYIYQLEVICEDGYYGDDCNNGNFSLFLL
jgi:DNA-binding beta-propeller fold protein YncE